jgi:hypothetical protein
LITTQPRLYRSNRKEILAEVIQEAKKEILVAVVFTDYYIVARLGKSDDKKTSCLIKPWGRYRK